MLRPRRPGAASVGCRLRPASTGDGTLLRWLRLAALFDARDKNEPGKEHAARELLGEN